MLFGSCNLPQGPQLQTKKALLLIDLQNDFVTPTGKLPVDNTAEFLSKLPILTSKFRDTGPVVWINTTFRQPCPTISPQIGSYSIVLKSLVEHSRQHGPGDVSVNAGLASQEDDTVSCGTLLPAVEDDAEAFLSSRVSSSLRCCLPNSEGVAMPPTLASSVDRQKDIVFSKSQYSAFAEFSLVMQLRARMVNELYICGSLSNVGVYATVLDAVQQGFSVILVEDCLGFRDPACHLEAMTRMADDFCAAGIDYSELMDDLCGLLGDVIPASQYTRTFQLSQHSSSTRPSQSQKVRSWMETIDDGLETEEPQPTVEVASKMEMGSVSCDNSVAATVPRYRESPPPPRSLRCSPKQSPPRKRSISDRDEQIDNHCQRSGTPPTSQGVPGSLAASLTKSRSSAKKSKVHATVVEVTPEPTRPQIFQCLSPGNSEQSLSLENIKSLRESGHSSLSSERVTSQPVLSSTESASKASASRRKKKPKHDLTYLGPDDTIGDADSSIVHDVLLEQEANESFSKLKAEIAWLKMCHRTGEVPRLVAVQGIVHDDGAMPIYRHPADESSPLLPFNRTVDSLRHICEGLVGHQLNHVLIQYYRNGEDNISEHSDKSLDIVRDSSIVNLSLGAMRTMTLRMKKISQPQGSSIAQHSSSNTEGAPRTAQRIRLPHNSLFVLGQRTNTNWLHSIRADKRPDCEKLEEELAFGGERISLTFRHIGTFINLQKQVMWGQGATSKIKEHAKAVLQGIEADRKGEEMIIGFGRENHLSERDFDWHQTYGAGFDVVNFEVKADDKADDG
ncbi:hypothetical protein LTR70_001971 [Exophiala xenobiotica]|uniref:Fe2OG dioxygenase domain-containing protein n=1 Tax=Lithohypha guttulata TaxID=1690604 RepID=A0ABR0K8Z0_9EURO|nr:hypothetical protein LTR24_005358 [Lithohypha guttulata]KAK5326956.1 hypothetical protein LTR70_001971 [Exophiala xenobiotica]